MTTQYALFIGRWRTFHDGHLWLVKQQLDQGNPVCIAIRPTDEEPDRGTRFDQIFRAMKKAGYTYEDDFKIIYLPVDISSVNYGRGVGYEVIRHVPPDDVAAVSATEILNG